MSSGWRNLGEWSQAVSTTVEAGRGRCAALEKEQKTGWHRAMSRELGKSGRVAFWEDVAGDQVEPQCLSIRICEMGSLQSLAKG